MSFCLTGCRTSDTLSSVWQVTLLKRWQAWVEMRGGLGGQFACPYSVNLDDVLKGSRISFCVKMSSFLDWRHNDDSAWQVQHFGCIGLIFRGRRNYLSRSLTIPCEKFLQRSC